MCTKGTKGTKERSSSNDKLLGYEVWCLKSFHSTLISAHEMKSTTLNRDLLLTALDNIQELIQEFGEGMGGPARGYLSCSTKSDARNIES